MARRGARRRDVEVVNKPRPDKSSKKLGAPKMVGALAAPPANARDALDPRILELTEALEEKSRELRTAVEFQTATGELLKVISGSTFSLQAVLDSLARAAASLCDADHAWIFRREGDGYRWAASYGHSRDEHNRIKEFMAQLTIAPGRDTLVGRTALDCRPTHIPDVLADPEYRWSAAKKVENYRTTFGTPLLRQGVPIGVLALTRAQVRPFTEKQIKFAAAFADQAVSAIQNVLLFEEIGARNREITEALEQQKATSEILRVISTSPTDVQPVFETIVQNAVTLCGSLFANVFRFDGELLHFVTSHNVDPGYIELFQTKYPMRPDLSQVSGRVIAMKSVVRLEDALADPEYDKRFPFAMKWRRMLGVPMLRKSEPIGVIVVGWAEAGPVPANQEKLLKQFADQAVIALENTRLFEEVQAKTQQVEEQARELADLNRTLETRVAEQVEQLTRMSKLERFLSPKISSLIMAGEADDPLKTRRAEITVVYVDLRGFTAFTETTDPEDVIQVLREYHAELGRAITAHDGTIEHFAGDGAMILFNAPMPMEDHALQAIRMTLQIRESVRALTSGWKKRGFDLGFGAGIAGGYATMGTIGFAERLDYGAIGIVCNLASRLCGEASDGQILISPRVFVKVEDQIEAESVGELTLKGFHRPVAVYKLIGLRARKSA